MRRRLNEQGNAFYIECHPAVVESLIGADGESIEEMEHDLKRGLYIRANFDFVFEEFEIESGFIEDMDREYMCYRRAQVVDCNVRSSSDEASEKAIAWTDNGYYVELISGHESIGQRVKVVLQDIRRAFAVGDVIVQGAVRPL